MTASQLREAEAAFKKAYRAAELSRERRNALIRAALKGGLTYQQVADATGLSRGRLSQIARTS